MRVHWNVLLLASAIFGSCQPEEKCSGELYWDPVEYACRTCPKNATFKDGSCDCAEPYEFTKGVCVLRDGAVIEEPDAGMMAGGDASCATYCDFANVCIGENGLAMSALSDIVTGLHADNKAACTNACMSDLGGDGASDPVVACVEAGRDAAMCADMDSQEALGGAMMLVGDCCRTRPNNALCKSICKTLKANALVASMLDYCP